MSDLALIWNNETGEADLAMAGADLMLDEGLRTAVIISLFTDALARPDDVLPAEAGGDRRGWWGDAYARVAGDQIGSRLWLWERGKIIASEIEGARAAAQEALDWMVRDGVASAVRVNVWADEQQRRRIDVQIDRPTGASRRFDFVWTAP